MLLQNGLQPIVTPYLSIPPIVNVTLDNVNVGLAFHVLMLSLWIGQLRIDCTYFSKSSELIMQVYMLHSTMPF